MLLLMNVLTYFIDSSVAFEIFFNSVYRTRMLLPVYTLIKTTHLFLLYIMLPLLIEVNKDSFNFK